MEQERFPAPSSPSSRTIQPHRACRMVLPQVGIPKNKPKTGPRGVLRIGGGRAGWRRGGRAQPPPQLRGGSSPLPSEPPPCCSSLGGTGVGTPLCQPTQRTGSPLLPGMRLLRTLHGAVVLGQRHGSPGPERPTGWGGHREKPGGLGTEAAGDKRGSAERAVTQP